MKTFWGFALLLLLTPSLVVAFTLSQNLRMGSAGPAVLELQRFLNQDPDTTLARAGPGSPGNETSFFGRATYGAVIKFQEKYRSEVLFPVSLYQGTGIVGPLTRGKMSSLSLSAGASAPSVQPVSSQPNLQPYQQPNPLPSNSSVTNPNFVNLDKFIAAVEKVGKQKGYSDSRLNSIAASIKIAAATTTNFRAEFNKVRAKAKHVSQFPNLSPRPLALGKFFKSLFTSLGILPAVAEAKVGTPFGGAVFYVYFCSCSENWLIEVEPLPPAYATLLTYYEGTQEFRNYNTPFTDELLGFYTPGAGVCISEPESDCAVDIPNEGLITGTLGSSI